MTSKSTRHSKSSPKIVLMIQENKDYSCQNQSRSKLQKVQNVKVEIEMLTWQRLKLHRSKFHRTKCLI